MSPWSVPRRRALAAIPPFGQPQLTRGDGGCAPLPRSAIVTPIEGRAGRTSGEDSVYAETW